MDIQGLVNPGSPPDMKREPESSVALDRGGIDAQLGQDVSPSLASSQTTIRRNSNDASQALHLELYTSPPAKRPINGISPAIAPMPTKRKPPGDFTGENGKSYRTRRRALQACEACRSKKSKCDNDRPSCGSCIQHGIECIYKASNIAPMYLFAVLYCADDRLDPGTEILLDKLKEVMSMLNDYSQRLNRIEQSTRIREKDLPHRHNLKSAFSPTDIPAPLDDTQVYQIPKKITAGVDYFMSLPFVETLLPERYRCESLVSDSPVSCVNWSFPNLDRAHVEHLITIYLAEIHPFHPVLEISTIERLKTLVCEEGLLWNAESALILEILALGAMHASKPYHDYYFAAIRRMGYGIQNLGVTAIQIYYLQGFASHLICF